MKKVETQNSYLNIPSNGSTSGSQASNCKLKVEAAIEEISTAFIASDRPWVASLILVIVASKSGVIWGNYNQESGSKIRMRKLLKKLMMNNL